MKKLIFSLLLCGCVAGSIFWWRVDSQSISEAPKIESISEYDYNKALGHNAAIKQFCPEKENMLVDLSNKKVVIYTNKDKDGERNGYDGYGYAEGYHRALEYIFRPTTCSR